MTYDDVLLHLGEFGRYQKRIYFLLCVPAISCALHKLAWVFLGAKADHRCRLPYEKDNAVYELSKDLWNVSIPWDSAINKPSMCRRYDGNFTEEYLDKGLPSNRTIPCERWVYDHTKYESSAVMEFNLVCDEAWLEATAQAIFMSGVLVGSLLFGDLSDRCGRRPIFFASLVLQVFAGVIAGLAPEYYSFNAARFVVGATTSGVFLVAYVIAMEMVGPSKRVFAGVVCQLFFTVGYLITAAFAYYIPNWRHLQIALSIPGIAFISYWWFIPESVRWLLTKGRHAEAKVLLYRVAKENNVSLPEDMVDGMCQKETKPHAQKNYSVLDLMRYPNLRKKSLNIFFNWFVNSGTYYGLSLNTSNLGGNDYLNFVISGAVEVPAYTFLLLTLNRWGRKFTLCGSMLTGGLALLLTVFVPDSTVWLLITLAMIGKLAITASYGIIYVFSAEQFPTVIRNAGIGTSSTCARVGGILAPYVNLLAFYWKPLPLIIFGAFAFVAGLLALLLPETLRQKLPESIEDGELFGKTNGIGVAFTPENDEKVDFLGKESDGDGEYRSRHGREVVDSTPGSDSESANKLDATST